VPSQPLPFAPLRLAGIFLIALLGASLRSAEIAYHEAAGWAQFPPNVKWGLMTAVDLDSHGDIYALQRSDGGRVMVFAPTGQWLRSWGEGTFPSAHGLRIDARDNVWITDRGLHQVLKFSPAGELLLALGKKGVAGGNDSTEALNGPSDLVVDPKGDIFVSDGESTNTRVVQFSSDGRFIRCWGSKGSGPGQLNVPHAIVMDTHGRLYVANRSNLRVEIFDQNGGYLGVMTNAGTPYGLFMTKDDLLYVSDGTPGRGYVTVVHVKSQKVLAKFGGLHGPHMIAVAADGAVYVAETQGNSVRKFVRQ
jgi:DNA-binding beta-propeller fold protein YncE